MGLLSWLHDPVQQEGILFAFSWFLLSDVDVMVTALAIILYQEAVLQLQASAGREQTQVESEFLRTGSGLLPDFF